MSRPTGHRGRPAAPRTKVAIFIWGNLIEDFLDPLGVTLDEFARKMSGGWLFGYAEALQSAGVETCILCVSGAHGPERIVNPETGRATIVLPAGGAQRAFRRTFLAGEAARHPGLGRALDSRLSTPRRALAAALQAEGVTHLICQEYEYPRFDIAQRVARRAGVGAYATFQGGVPEEGRLGRWIRRRTIAAADGLIVASKPEIDRVKATYGVPDERIAPIPNPIDLREWRAGPRAPARAALSLPEAAFVAICHCRIDYRRKGLDILLEAWRCLAADHPGRDLRLHLVGSGSDDEILQAEIDRAPVPGLRWQRGYSRDRDALRRELSAADLYVMASRHEGFPVAPLEAMACGLPAVLSDAPGAREILGEAGECGELVAVGDAAALSGAIGRLLADPARRAACGAAARRRVEAAFSLESVGEALAAFLPR